MTEFNKSISNFLKENKDKTVSSSRDFKFDKELKYCIDNGFMASKNSNNYIITKLGLKVVELGSLDKYLTRQKTKKIFKQLGIWIPTVSGIIFGTMRVLPPNSMSDHNTNPSETDSIINHMLPSENRSIFIIPDSEVISHDSVLND